MKITTHVLTNEQELTEEQKLTARTNIGAVAGIKTEAGTIEPDEDGYVQIPEVVDADENTKGIVKLTDNPDSTALNTAASPAAIRAALANFGGFKVVDLDPETEEPGVPLEERSTKYIYLTKDEDSHETDPYTEWIWVVEEAPAEPHWDIIGTTSVDLSGYAQKTFVESFIAPNYDPTKTVYYQGEICMYEDKCYRAKNIIMNNGSAIGAFDSSKWAETNFADSRLQILNYYVNYEWPSAEVTNKAIQSGSLVGLRYITPANPQYYEKENTMYWLHSYYMDDAGNVSATFLNTEPTIYAEPEYVEYNAITYSIIKYTSSGNEHWTKENGLRCPFYTYDDQYKLSGIAEGAQVNKIDSISVNDTAVEPDANKNVNIVIPKAVPDPVAPNQMLFSADGVSWAPVTWEFVQFATIGGQDYPTVKIGNQEWLGYNLDLKFAGLVVGDTSGTTTTELRGNYYNNDETTNGWGGKRYGLLYNWIAASYMNSNRATLFPGWHVPTAADIDDLVTYLGTTVAGTKLKSTTGWVSGNGDGSTEFNGMPVGYYYEYNSEPTFHDEGMMTFYWTSESYSDPQAKYWQLTPGPAIYTGSLDKDIQCSIRLVKDSV